MKIDSTLFSLSRVTRRTALAAVVLGATALTGCYVVPVQPAHPVTSTVYVTCLLYTSDAADE